jgi:MtN3 and saliva related transmembrane protein
MFIEILATIMGVAIAFGYYPQAYTIIKHKSAQSVSTLSYLLFGFGTLTWLIYGIVINSLPIIVSYTIGVIGSWSVSNIKIHIS